MACFGHDVEIITYDERYVCSISVFLAGIIARLEAFSRVIDEIENRKNHNGYVFNFYCYRDLSHIDHTNQLVC